MIDSIRYIQYDSILIDLLFTLKILLSNFLIAKQPKRSCRKE